jgi:hypothetical protein
MTRGWEALYMVWRVGGMENGECEVIDMMLYSRRLDI